MAKSNRKMTTGDTETGFPAAEDATIRAAVIAFRESLVSAWHKVRANREDSDDASAKVSFAAKFSHGGKRPIIKTKLRVTANALVVEDETVVEDPNQTTLAI